MKKGHVLAFFLLAGLILPVHAPFSLAQARVPRDSNTPKHVTVAGRSVLDGLAGSAGHQRITLTSMEGPEPLRYAMQVTHFGQVQYHLFPGEYVAFVRGAKWLTRRVEINAVRTHATIQV